MIELKPHVLPGVVVPLTITLIALSMPSVRRDIQKNGYSDLVVDSGRLNG